MNKSYSLKEAQQYIWQYFALHAGQRMTTFNYYVVLSSFTTTGLVTTFQPNFSNHYLGITLGILLLLLSFIFWKLDRRVRFLIKHSETFLKQIESELSNELPFDAIKVFTNEEFETKQLKDKRVYFWQRQLSYSENFSIVFLSFAAFGFVGLTSSLWLVFSF